MLFRNGYLVIVIVCMLFSHGPAHGEQPLNVAVFSGVPWANLSANKIGDGIVPRFWAEVAKRADLNLNIMIQPYKRMIYSLGNGTADMAIFFKSVKSEKVADPVLKIVSLPTVIISRFKDKTHKYDDFHQLRVAQKMGVLYEPKFDRDEKITKIKTPDYGDAVELMIRERVDAVVGSEVSLSYQMGLKKLEAKQYSRPFVLKNNDVYLQISKTSKMSGKQRQKVIQAVKELGEAGLYQSLINQAVTYAQSQ